MARATRCGAMAAVLGVLVGIGCSDEVKAPPKREAWVVEAISVETNGAAKGVEKCGADGQGCAPLVKGERIEGGLVKTAPGTRASLKLDDATRIDLGESSVAALLDENDRAVEVREGAAVLRHEGKPGTNGVKAVRAGGAALTWSDGEPVSASVRVIGGVAKDSAGSAAVVTVQRGRLLARSKGADEVAVLAGETARVEPGKAADKRAVWSGRAAPVSELSDGPPEVSDARVPAQPRGLGAMTARVPATGEVIGGVRLKSHKTQIVVRDGFARTEIEEEFYNETSQVLEGRYVFPLPPDASISRLALWVGKDLVEGEVLERKRAAAIFQTIVDDTVRPRDPALLEWVSGSEFSLKIFPIPAKSSRKVILAYNQILPSEGGRARYVYPLSLGADRTASIEDFSISMTAHSTGAAIGDISTSGYPASISTEEGKVTINFSSKSFVPSSDFGVSYSSEAKGAVRGAAYSPKEGELEGRTKKEVAALRAASAKKKPPPQDGFFAIRVAAELPEGAPLPPHVRRDVALVIDTSHSQSRETFEGEVKIAAGLLRQMDPDEQFVVLACDSACEAYPEKGLEKVSDASINAAEKWISAKKIGGSSDVAGALLEAAARLKAGGEGQVVYIGDGAATAGELSANSIAARVKPALAEKRIDLRFMGAGRTVDEVTLGGLARALGAAYERVETGESLASRIADLGMGLRAPVVRALAVEPSPSLRDVYPREIPNLRLGQEVVLFGRLSGEPPADVTLRGEMAGAPYSLKKAVQWDAGATSREPGAGNPLVPRLWAEAKIRELEASGEGRLMEEAIALSMRFHVMARGTALLVLENEQMFAEFGVRRTTLEAEDQSDHAFGAPRAAASSAPGEAAADSFNGGADIDPANPYSAGPAVAASKPAPRPAAGGPRSMPYSMDSYDGGGGSWSMPPPPPPATHVVEGEDWAKGLEDALEKLRKAAIDAPKSRRAQVSLIRGLLARGRFSEALTEAAKLAEADPDLADAHLFVAQAAAGTGDGRRAAMELDTQAELDPRRASAHIRAARAFEVLGDERRACAHWRAAMDLKPTSDEAIRDALRCRARALDGRDAVLAEATALPKKGKKVEALIARLQAGETPRFEPERAGTTFKASVKCEQGVTDAPTVVVIAPGGTIYSPWTPGTAPSEPGSVALQSVQDGLYRTLTTGGGDGARCELIVDARGVVRKTPVSVAGSRKVIRTQVQLWGPSWW